MQITKLSESETKKKLNEIDAWEIKNKKLYKLFKFKNFNQALGFMVRVGIVCEQMNHHPEWSNVYGNVEVNLVTHKVAGVTNLDFELASKMDKIFKEFNL